MLGFSPVGLHLFVADVDAVVAHAVDAGATVIRAVADQFYGDRNGSVRDPFGHVWHVTTHIEDVSPDEIARRMAALDNQQTPETKCPETKSHDTARSHPVLGDRRSPDAALPGGARLVVWTIVNLEVWDIARPMARQVLPAPTGQVSAARCAELGLARIRHAGWRLALFRPLPPARHSSDCVDQRAGLRGLRARRPQCARFRLGVHGPRLRADADPQS